MSTSPGAVAVAADAIQTMEGKPSSSCARRDGFAPQPVELGRSDGKRTEVPPG
jgi:cobalt-zinc-cadmium efflux system membrane fusion protein